MSEERAKLNRRSFLRTSAPLICSPLVLWPFHFSPWIDVQASMNDQPVLSADTILFLRDRLLRLVNEERSRQGLVQVQIDERACRVAEDHARDMADGAFLSHWGRDGLKPYHRYSFSGGTEATAENVSAVDRSFPVTSAHAVSDLLDAHESMYDETAPDDGHRKTILAPQHTHVGFGFAVSGSHVRLTELFVSRHVVVEKYVTRQQRESSFSFAGRVIEPAFTLEGIDLYYEPLPVPPDPSWLRVARSYALPDQRQSLLPRLDVNLRYRDGSRGDIDLFGKGRFQVRIKLGKLAGIYTVVVWLRGRGFEKGFPATEVCVRAE